MMRTRATAWMMYCGMLWVAAASAASAGDAKKPEMARMIGFRGDGHGVFPADCRPVMDFSIPAVNHADKGGKPATTTANQERNIVWKCILPTTAFPGNNGGLIIVKGKIYKMKEPTSESVGPLLYCIDSADGKVLWKRDVNHVDLVPKADREQLRKDLLLSNAYEPARMQWGEIAHQIYRAAMERARQGKADLTLGAKNHGAADVLEPFLTNEEKVSLSEVDKALAPYGLKARMPGFRGEWLYNSPDSAEVEAARLRNSKFGYRFWIDAWIRQGGGAIGYASQTPCSDGERIYVTTAFYDIYGYDLNGTLLWAQTWYDDKGSLSGSADHFPSPVVFDDKVIRYWTLGQTNRKIPPSGWITLRCFDKLTGKPLWTVDKTGAEDIDHNNCYALGTPIVTTFDGVRLIYLADGRVVRARDGKILASRMGWCCSGTPFAAQGNMAVYPATTSGGQFNGDRREINQGLYAYRLSWTDEKKDALKVELAWKTPAYNKSCVIYDDMVYAVGKEGLCGFNLANGEKVRSFGSQWNATYKTNLGFSPKHYCLLAGNLIVGPTRGEVFLSNDAKIEVKGFVPEARVTSSDYNYDYKYWQYAQQRFYSGNRWFLQRGYNNPEVWCIGDPQVATRLSQVHAP